MSDPSSFPIGYMTGQPTISGQNLIYADIPDGGTAGTIHSWNINSLSETWQYPMSGVCMGGTAVGNNTVYAGGLDGVLHAVDLDTGTEQWTNTFDFTQLWGTPLVTSGGLVLVTTSLGILFALNPDGSVLWGCAPPMAIRPSSATSPVLSDSGQTVLYGISFMTADTSAVVAVNLTSGTFLWQSPVPLITSDIWNMIDLCTGPGMVIVPCTDQTVRSLNVTTGATNWVYTALDIVQSTPACDGQAVYFGDTSGRVTVVGAQTGTMLWSMTPGFVGTGIVISDGSLYFGVEGGESQFGSMVCADISGQGQGAYVILASTPGQMCTPAVSDQTAYYATSIMREQGTTMCILSFDWNLASIAVEQPDRALLGEATATDSYQGVVTVQNQPYLPLTVWATGPLTLTVSGASYQVDVNQSASILTDANGQLTFTAQSSTSPLPMVLLSAPFLPQGAAYMIVPPS